MDNLDQSQIVPSNDADSDQLVKVGPAESRILFRPSFDVITPDDITIVFCVRLHEGNPWIVDRLAMMANYYDPCPAIVIVDFGSEPEKAAIVKQVCDLHGYKYHYVDDTGVFSLAAGRNTAFEQTDTDFVFFCDPDFVSERDLFSRLAKNASALNMRNVVDIIQTRLRFTFARATQKSLKVSRDIQSSNPLFCGFFPSGKTTPRQAGKAASS
jgi:predicted glycosyltransferase involved in capsule biosynthesis